MRRGKFRSDDSKKAHRRAGQRAKPGAENETLRFTHLHEIPRRAKKTRNRYAPNRTSGGAPGPA